MALEPIFRESSGSLHRLDEALKALYVTAGDKAPDDERVPEAGEPKSGAGARIACRPTASTGGMASGTGREMAQ
jgi:hypothetical protein